jgi:thioredoxin 1
MEADGSREGKGENRIMAAVGVMELTDQNFDETIAASKTPVLVDFWAAWCGPCRRVAPIVEEIAREYDGKLTVAKVDIDQNQEVTVRYGIQSIPTLMIFKDGKMQDRLIGAYPKEVLVENINRFV